MAIAAPIGAALLKGAADIGSSLMSNSAARGATDRQLRWERERAMNAHQWEVKDLEAAGLNPVLSATSGGATTGSISPVMPDTSGISSAGQAMFQAIAMNYDNKVKEAQAKNIEADTEKKEEETKNITKDTELKGNQIKRLNADIKKINSDIQRNNWLNSRDKAEISKITHEITNIDSTNELIKVEKELKSAQTELAKEEQVLKIIAQKQGIETYKGQIYDNQIKAVHAKMRYVDETINKIHSVLDMGQKFANMVNTGTSSIKNLADSGNTIIKSIPIVSKLTSKKQTLK